MTPTDFSTLKDCINDEVIKESDPLFGSILAYTIRHIDLRSIVKYAIDFNDEIEAHLLIISIKALAQLKIQAEPVTDWNSLQTYSVSISLDKDFFETQFSSATSTDTSLPVLVLNKIIEHLDKNAVTRIETDCLVTGWNTDPITRNVTVLVRYKKLT